MRGASIAIESAELLVAIVHLTTAHAHSVMYMFRFIFSFRPFSLVPTRFRDDRFGESKGAAEKGRQMKGVVRKKEGEVSTKKP